MKFQIPNIHHSKVNRRTHAHTHTQTDTDRQTDRQAESNMPFQLFQSWGHKKPQSTTLRYDFSTVCLVVNFVNITNDHTHPDRWC